MKKKYFKGQIYIIDPILNTGKDVPRVDASLVENKLDIVHFNKNFDFQHLPENFYFNFLALENTVYKKKRSKKYVLNDIMPWEGDQPNGGESFVCSLKFEQIAKEFNLGNSKFYNAKLRNKDEFVEYRVCHFLCSLESIMMWKYENEDPRGKFNSYVDYPKSIFTEYYNNSPIGPNEYLINNYLEWRVKNNELIENSLNLGFKKIQLTQEASQLDMLPFNEFTWLISERFHDALVEEGITGIYMEEITDVEIFTS